MADRLASRMAGEQTLDALVGLGSLVTLALLAGTAGWLWRARRS
ncbi:hypothetical protein [Streptomyces sp. NPDC005828]